MNDENIVRSRREPDGSMVQVFEDGTTRPLESRTDWARLDAMTDAEIELNALLDPDSPPLTDEEMSDILHLFPSPQVIRRELRLSQEAFAERFGVPLGTLRDWEQGKSTPDTAARTLLRVIEANPKAVEEALKR